MKNQLKIEEPKRKKRKINHKLLKKLDVYTTRDYDAFYFLEINRSVNERLVSRIQSSIRTKGLLEEDFIQAIETDEGLAILDGQHRFRARQALNLEIPYILIKGDMMNIIIASNIQTQWTEKQFVMCYAKHGNKNYKKVLELMALYPEVRSLRLYISLLTNSSYQGLDRKRDESIVKDGLLEVTNWDNALKACEKLMEFSFLKGINYAWGHSVFFNALMKTWEHPRYNHDRFKKSLKKYNNHLSRNNTTKNYLIKFSELYNMGYEKKDRIYFQNDLV
jgi:hypothetical protein